MWLGPSSIDGHDALWLVLRPGVCLLRQQVGPMLVWLAGWRGTLNVRTAGWAATAGVAIPAAIAATETRGRLKI